MTKLNIPFFDYPDVFKQFEEEFVDTLRSVGRRGAFIMQSDLETFESKLAEFAGVNYAIGVANATDALELLLMADGIKDGDEVIMSAHTMIATASAVRMLGGVPVPVDMADDRNIDTSKIEASITSKTKYIMPTHLNGRIADMQKIVSIARENNLQIVEDSAQSLGARYHGQHGGSFGLGGCISFYPAKVLGCLGDGGAVLTNDEKIYAKIMSLRDHGRSNFGVYESWGRNSRLDNLQAAFLNVQFKRYPHVIERRRAIAAMYGEILSEVHEIGLPPLPDEDHGRFDIFQNFEITASNRDALVAHLREDGIGTLNQWGGLGLNHIRSLGMGKPLEKTDQFFRECTMLPLNFSITNDQIHYVCRSIKRFYGVS
jgi:dTDP-4-amino-4,6-dideoxygalactose transaminase